MNTLIVFFGSIDSAWHSNRTSYVTSWVLVVVFIMALGRVALVGLSEGAGVWSGDVHLFYAVELVFSVLLFFEVISLVFILPRSVADSVGKQFEILSLILLRDAFKAFGMIQGNPFSSGFELIEMAPVLTDAFGALSIFFITGIFYRLQQHYSITNNDAERFGFIRMKKMVSLFLLIAFLVSEGFDLFNLVLYDLEPGGLTRFYTLLVFADVFILIWSMRYNTKYVNLFRYSSFTLATVLIRLALSAESYMNVGLGMAAGLFVLGTTLSYNYFRRSPAS